MESREKYNLKGHFKDADMQAVIGWILRIGVALSMAVVVVGGAIYIYRHGHSTPDFRSFKKMPYFINSTEGILQGVIHLRGQTIIQLGIMILIATPILRVVFSVIGFLIEKDYLYTFISALVLLIILVSMFFGYIG